MRKIISNVKGSIILSYQENGYQSVINQFQNANYINIVTYNINTFEKKTDLIKELREVRSSTPIKLVLNVPARREDYLDQKTGQINEEAVNDAKRKIKYTLDVLERSKFGDLNVYFNFDNHSKLVMTDKVAYIGSQNFSDSSKNNFELGVLVDDPREIDDINNIIFNEIVKNSILYTTSEYAILMNEITGNMRSFLQNIREDIFTLVGDEPYIQEIEVIDIDNIYIYKKEWEKFKELHYKFENIVEKLVNDYPEEFNRGKAEIEVDKLSDLVDTFTFKLDDFANFKYSEEENMMWENFQKNDTGDNLDSALESASEFVRNYKKGKFHYIEDIGNELVQSFDDIEQCIENIEKVIEEIKTAMINKSVYTNIDKIKNY